MKTSHWFRPDLGGVSSISSKVRKKSSMRSSKAERQMVRHLGVQLLLDIHLLSCRQMATMRKKEEGSQRSKKGNMGEVELQGRLRGGKKEAESLGKIN